MNTTKKHLILLASLSTFAAQAHAAADGFNFYGLIDGGMAATKIKGAGGTSRTEFVTGGYAPNFVGMTGQKSMGAMKGGFQLEQGFLLNNNPGTTTNSRYFFGPDSIFNRRANVYIEGDFGAVRLGTQGNIAFGSTVLAFDPRSGSNYGSALATVDIDGGLGTIDTSALSYTSPSLSGFTFAGSMVASQRNTPTSNVNSGYRGSAGYKMDNFSAAFAFYNNETKSTVATPDATGNMLGAAYKMGAFTMKGLYVKQKNAPLNNLKTYGFGGGYELTPALTLDAGIYRSTDAAAGYKTKTTGIGAQYKIIKDLSLYAQYANVKNAAAATAAFNFAGPTIQPGSITAGQSASTLNVGALFAFF